MADRSHSGSGAAVLRKVVRPHVPRLALACALTIVAAIAGVAQPLVVGTVLDTLFPQSPNVDSGNLLLWLALLCACILIGAGCSFAHTTLAARTQRRLLEQLRGVLYRRYLTEKFDTAASRNLGRVHTRLMSDTSAIASLVSTVVGSVLTSLVSIIASLIAMSTLDWRLTILAFSFVFGLVIAYRRVALRQERATIGVQERAETLSAFTYESLSSPGQILTWGYRLTDWRLDAFSDHNCAHGQASERLLLTGRLTGAVTQVGLALMPVMVYLIVGFGGRGESVALTSAGAVVAFTALQARLLGPISSVLQVAAGAWGARANVTRFLEELGSSSLEVRQRSTERLVESERGSVEEGPALKVESVTYKYPDATEHAVERVSFSLAREESLAIQGPSGAGKSTLGMIIAGVLTPQSGNVSYGPDLSKSGVRFVAQSPHFLNGTLKENIELSSSLEPEWLQRGLEALGLERLIDDSKPDSSIGLNPGGAGLSSGEQQRLMVLRALMSRPGLLVLDEPSTNLDPVSLEKVVALLKEYKGAGTLIVITHDPTLAEICDHSLFLARPPVRG